MCGAAQLRLSHISNGRTTTRCIKHLSTHIKKGRFFSFSVSRSVHICYTVDDVVFFFLLFFCFVSTFGVLYDDHSAHVRVRVRPNECVRVSVSVTTLDSLSILYVSLIRQFLCSTSMCKINSLSKNYYGFWYTYKERWHIPTTWGRTPASVFYMPINIVHKSKLQMWKNIKIVICMHVACCRRRRRRHHHHRCCRYRK